MKIKLDKIAESYCKKNEKNQDEALLYIRLESFGTKHFASTQACGPLELMHNGLVGLSARSDKFKDLILDVADTINSDRWVDIIIDYNAEREISG